MGLARLLRTVLFICGDSEAMAFASVAAPCALALVTEAKNAASCVGTGHRTPLRAEMGSRDDTGVNSLLPNRRAFFQQQCKLGSGVGEEENYLPCAVVSAKNRTRRNEDECV